MRSLLALPFFLFFLSCSVFGQGSTIEAKVLDSISKSPVEYALVRLYKISDSLVLTGQYTDETGFFKLEELPVGIYYLTIVHDDYNPKHISKIEVKDKNAHIKLGMIALNSGSKELDEVVIERDKTALQLGIDKKVYNVSDDISTTGGSVHDVLNNVPSVEVDQDGGISLRGDDKVTILIDGKPSNMSGNGKSVLDGIPASSIERIEVVSNPSSKYDPDGSSGIINIVLKKNVKRGFNGSVDASAGTGNLYTASVGLSVRNSKFNLYGSYAFSYRDGYRNNYSQLDQIKNDTTFSLIQDRIGSDLAVSHTGKIGMDIYVKERNTLSWSISGNLSDRTRTGDQVNTRYINSTDKEAEWLRNSNDPGENQNVDFSLGYKWDFKENRGSIDWNVYQSLGSASEDGFYNQINLFPVNPTELNQRLFSKENNDFTTASVDFVRNLKAKIKLEAGLKMIQRNMKLKSSSETQDAFGEFVSDTLSNYNYKYTEGVYSGYGMVNGQVNKFNYQAGVRLEYSMQNPHLLSTNQSFENNYFNLFPSATVRYNFSEKMNISFGYSKRINRPNSRNLNPFTSYADPYNLRSGNPALKPEYIHSIDLNFDYQGKKFSTMLSLYQRYTNEVIQRVKLFYENGTSIGTFANIDHSVSSGGEVIFQYKPYSIWRNMLSINGNYITYTDESSSANWNREGFVFGMKFSSTVELLKKTLTLQINGRYSAPSVTAQGKMQPRGSIDFSIDKSLDKGKWGIGLRVTDIFNTQGFSFEVLQPTIYQRSQFKWETRRLIMSVRYRFGKVEMKEDKRQQEMNPGGFDF